MMFYVHIQNGLDSIYTASVLGWPQVSITGSSPQEALDNVRETLSKSIDEGIIVPLEIPVNDSLFQKNVLLEEKSENDEVENPWLKYAGMFKDDPLFDEVLGYMEEERAALDEEMDFA